MKNRILSTVLTLCVLLSLLPMRAAAAEITNTENLLYRVSYVSKSGFSIPKIEGTDNSPKLIFERSRTVSCGGVITSKYTMDFTRSFAIEGAVAFAERDGVSFSLHTTPKKTSYTSDYNTCMLGPSLLNSKDWNQNNTNFTVSEAQNDMTNGLLWDFMQYQSGDNFRGTRFRKGAYSYQINSKTSLSALKDDTGANQKNVEGTVSGGNFKLNWVCTSPETAVGNLTLEMGNTTFTYTNLNAIDVFGNRENAKNVYFSLSTYLPSFETGFEGEKITQTKIAIDKAYYTDTASDSGSTLGVETSYYIDTDGNSTYETQLKESTLVAPNQTILARNKIYNKNKNAVNPTTMALLIPNLSSYVAQTETKINSIDEDSQKLYWHEHGATEEIENNSAIVLMGKGPLNSTDQFVNYTSVTLPAGGDGNVAYNDAYATYEYTFTLGENVTRLAQTVQLGTPPFTPAVIDSNVYFNSPAAFEPNASDGKIMYGVNDTAEKIGSYRVVSKDKTDITLFYDGPSVVTAGMAQTGISTWLNGDFFTTYLTKIEQAALLPYIKDGNRIVLPSEEEVKDNGVWGMTGNDRATADTAQASTDWWLGDTGRAVTQNGTQIVTHEDSKKNGIRPTFKLNLGNVLFVTDAETAAAKDGTVSPNLDEISDVTKTPNAYKLTLVDTESAFAIAEDSTVMTTWQGGELTLNYSDATVGENSYISAFIADNTGKDVYYGRLLKPSTTSGTAIVNVPVDMDNGKYSLKLFSETLCPEKATDYGSRFQAVNLTLDNKLTGTVSLSGAVEYGAPLSAEVTGSNAWGALQYQWKLNGASIDGATSKTYTPKSTDIGNTLSCEVSDGGKVGTTPRTDSIVSDGAIVGKKTVTAKADDKSIIVGGALPTFTVSFLGFVGTDTVDTVIENYVDATASTATDGLTAGSFLIAPALDNVRWASGMDALYTLTFINGTLTVQAPYNPITVPVTGSDITVKTEVTISGSNVTVKAPTTANLNKIISAASQDGKSVKIDLSGLSDKLTNVNLPANIIQVVGESVAAGGVAGLIVTVPNGNTVAFNRTAAASISGAANGKGLTLSIDERIGTNLTAEESTLLGSKKATNIFDLTLKDSTGNVVSDFSGGTATVTLRNVKMIGKLADYALFHKMGDKLVPQSFTPIATQTADIYDLMLDTTGWSSYLLTYPYSEKTNPFTDVADGAYYYDAVLWAADNGVTNGTSATTFTPNLACTRAQAVTFLWRAMGSPEPTNTSCPFTDVTADAYFYKALLWATETGITVGTSKTTFSPDMTVTRSQTVTFLWRTAGTPEAMAATPFTDVASNAYYCSAVLWAVEKNITAGTGATTFSPLVSCSRAQIVTFLYRYLS